MAWEYEQQYQDTRERVMEYQQEVMDGGDRGNQYFPGYKSNDLPLFYPLT